MSNKESGKILLFTWAKKPAQSSWSPTVVWWTTQKIVDITRKSGWPIFWENDTNPHSCALDFFRILVATEYVRIRCEGDCIIENSILEVSSPDEGTFGILVRDFIRLTHKNFRKIEDIDYAVLEWLWEKNIKTSLKYNDIIPPEERNLTAEETLSYKVEEISVWMGDYEYSVNILVDDNVIWKSNKENFDLTNHNITLLDMILCALDDAETFENFSTNWATIDVIYQEGDEIVSTTHISPKLGREVIYTSLLRINKPIYSKMTSVEARLGYFVDHVISKLSGDKMLG